LADLTYVCFYLSYRKMLAGISDTARGRLVLAMLDYAETGVEPQLTGGAKTLWPLFQFQIDHDRQKYRERCEKNRINGAKGGSASRKPKVSECSPTGAKEKANEKDNEKEKEKEREKDTYHTPPASFPPDVEQVKAYAREQGLTLDAGRFVDHYASNGWMVGKNPMRDWQAAVRNWTRKERDFGKTELAATEFGDVESLYEAAY